MQKSSLPLVILHWLLVLFVVTSFLTGLRIAADDPNLSVMPNLPEWLPQGAVFFWHLLSAIGLTAIITGYFVMQWRAGTLSRFRLPNGWFKGLLVEGKSRWQLINLLSYWLLLLVLLLTLITGLLNYFLPTGELSLLVERVHFFTAWFFPLYLVLHVILHLLIGGFSKLISILVPRFRLMWPGAWGVAAVVLFIPLVVVLSTTQSSELLVTKTSAPPIIDGEPAESVWEGAPTLRLLTNNGVNLTEGSTPVTMQALYDEEFVYFLFQWPDSTRSQKHLPLVKTEDGWRVVQTDFMEMNEDTYYEDKFALALAESPWAALTSVHLGPQPLADQPASRAERGLHFTTDGSVMDLWHWKSVRSNPNQQADDNHFGPFWEAAPQSPLRFSRQRDGNYPRYTAGYHKDPPVSWNGYAMNWEAFREGEVKPRRLPKDPDDLEALGSQNLSPDVSDNGEWWMEWNDTKPYTPEHDNYSVGTILPSVLIQAPMAWDRGQITAKGSWKDGQWRLEMKRKLDTKSEYDLPVKTGTYAWVAVFDHSQTHHSRHLLPIKLVLSEG